MAIVVRLISDQGTLFDRRVEGVVTVGRATDNSIELPGLLVALHHLRLGSISPVAVRAECVSGADITVNGKPGQRSAELHAGDEIEVGPHRIRIGVASAQGPVVLEVIQQSAAAAAAERSDNAPMSLAEAGWGQRRWAYGLGGAVVVVGLLLPLILRLIPGAGGLEHWVPSDHLWSSGQISNAHISFGHDCGVCHTSVFQRVRDQACLDCHTAVAAHADDHASLAEAELEGRRCASCHFEHAGADGVLNRHDVLCTDCHARPEDFSSLAESVEIDDFHHSHPPFRVEVGVRSEDGQTGVRRTLLSPDTRDQSGLVFPHALHLDPDGIRGADGKQVLECDSCHQPARGGVGFTPMTYREHCQSCHQLDVDFGGELLRLPHGDSGWVRAALTVAIERAKLGVNTETTEAVAATRPGRPGEVADRGGEPEPIDQIDDVFERRVCGKCHEVDRVPGTPATVPVPRLRQTWMVHARFTHDAHGAVVCDVCHSTYISEDSDELLLPQIETCRSCHSTVDSGQLFQSSCIDCHDFHQAERMLMGHGDGGSDTRHDRQPGAGP